MVKGKDYGDEDVVLLEASPSELDLCCIQLRSRWELASVINFLSVRLSPFCFPGVSFHFLDLVSDLLLPGASLKFRFFSLSSLAS